LPPPNHIRRIIAKRFLTTLNLSQLSSDPDSGSEGSIYFNSSLNVIRVYYDGAWHDSATAELIDYDNSNSDLVSVNIKSAIDELSLSKVDKSELSSNINLYPTTTESSISGYSLMVASLDDPQYNSTAVDIPTGVIGSSNVLLASLSSRPGVITGNPGIINITTIGNIRKTGGNNNDSAEFFFKVFHRNSEGTETLIGTSDTTGAVNPESSNYIEFSATAVVQFITFSLTDYIVIKYYGNAVSGNDAEYDFQFGGASPVRTLLPVPLSVIPASNASSIILDTSNFNNNLSGSNSTVQSALDTLDDLEVLPDQTGNSGKILSTDGSDASWSDLPDPIIPSGDSYPLLNLINGQLFYNTTSGRTAIQFGSVWKEFAYISDISTLDNGNSSTTVFSEAVDGGDSSTTVFAGQYDGGYV
jgi:hypothetical protein